MTETQSILASRRIDTLLVEGRPGEAEKEARALLARMEVGADYDTGYDRALTLRDMGLCLKDQGRPAEAVDWQRRALAAFQALEQTEQVLQMANTCRTDLADLYAALGQFAEAEAQYKAALEIDEKLGDDRGKAVDLGQLGNLALRRGDLPEAARRWQEALDTFRALGEPQSEAVCWHQLGVVAQKARQWEEAERCYREALRLKESLGDLPGAARTLNQLAIVAEGAGRLDEAEQWARRSLEILQEVGEPSAIAVAYHKLAVNLALQNRLDNAAENIAEALKLYEEQDVSENVIKAYATAAQIAEAQGRADEAARWRRQEQESYAAYAGSAHAIREWMPVIAGVVAVCQGDKRPLAELEPLFARLEKTDDWRNLIPAIRRILAGERDVDALCADLDRTDSTIIRTILAQLAGT